MSHWPGMSRMGHINEEWDHKLLAMIRRGDVEGMIAMSDRDIVSEGGNGGLELKNWVCAFAALGSKSAEIIDYQAVYEWVCGCAFAELEFAA